MADSITVWPGKDGWDDVDELDERVKNRNQAILEAIEYWLLVDDTFSGHQAWDEASKKDRMAMVRQALLNYANEYL